MVPVRLLTISGSLRAGAANTALLEAAALLAPTGVTVAAYDELAALPAFNPDLDLPGVSALPAAAADLRERVGLADGILISSPEYAHGIPGAFKNALDWLVGSVEFPGKPVALLGASTRAVYVRAQLTEVLTTMSARLVEEASITVPLPSRILDAAAIVADPKLAGPLRDAVAAFVRAVDSLRAGAAPAWQ
ncbi:MAG: NADPH-dependent FMN reductase [Gemmatimonadaceae bacterium]